MIITDIQVKTMGALQIASARLVYSQALHTLERQSCTRLLSLCMSICERILASNPSFYLAERTKQRCERLKSGLDSETVLGVAAREGRANRVRSVLAHAEVGVNEVASVLTLDTALHLACAAGHAEVNNPL